MLTASSPKSLSLVIAFACVALVNFATAAEESGNSKKSRILEEPDDATWRCSQSIMKVDLILGVSQWKAGNAAPTVGFEYLNQKTTHLKKTLPTIGSQ